MFIRVRGKVVFEIPALIGSSLCSPYPHWPSFGMYNSQGYTMEGVILTLLIRLLACAPGTDSGLGHCITALSSHHELSFEFQGRSNKNSKSVLKKSPKMGKNILLKNLIRNFSFISELPRDSDIIKT